MGESSEIALTYAKIFLRELSPKNDFLDTATWARFSDFFKKFEAWVLVKSFQKVIDFPVFGRRWVQRFGSWHLFCEEEKKVKSSNLTAKCAPNDSSSWLRYFCKMGDFRPQTRPLF